MVEMKPPDAVAPIVDDIAGKQGAGFSFEQADGTWGVAWYVHDLEDTVAEVDAVAVRKKPRGLDRLKADAIRIEACRWRAREHGLGHIALGDSVLDRRIAQDIGFGRMNAAVGEFVKAADVIAM